MNNENLSLTELQSLQTALARWCLFLTEQNYSNFAEIFQRSFQNLQQQFAGDAKNRYQALLNFQDSFRGGMGSINDLPIDDSAFRKAVEQERDKLIDKYYDAVFTPAPKRS